MPRNLSDDWKAACEVLDRAELLHLALADEHGPYCVPLNFVRVGRTLYLHSGLRGRKMDAFRAGAEVCFSAQVEVERKRAKAACKLGYRFRSVVGFGAARVVEEEKERWAAMDALVAKWSALTGAAGELPVNDTIFREKTAMVRIDVASATVRERT